MTAEEVIEKIQSLDRENRSETLDRMKKLLEKLGNPQEKVQFIHVGGTNGKGTVSAMLYTIYNRCEYKAGLYTSPHLFALNERIQVDGEQISDEKLGELGEKVLKITAELMAEGMDAPSQMELSLAVAMLHFVEQRTEIVMIESGKGGRHDATNALGVPVLTILTNIAVDHTESDKGDLEGVALEKASIIKAGTKVVLYRQNKEVMDAVLNICHNLEVSAHISSVHSIKKISQTSEGQKFSYNGKIYQLSLTGEHQRFNVALVLEAINVLKESGFGFAAEGVFAGLSRTVWPGRFERVHISPDFILDGCHNVQSLSAVTQTLQELYPEKSIIFLVGVLENKDYKSMIDHVLPFAKKFVTVTPNSPDALSGETLAEYLQGKTNCSVLAAANVDAGVQTVMELAEPDDVVCAWGSLDIVGEIRNALGLC